jgi:hypothetical protein
MPLKDMYESCGQCEFPFARVDTEAWGESSARRLMCPVCGWTVYEEINWDEGEPIIVKRQVSKGHGAFRLIPPGGYSGYNAFHTQPSIKVLTTLKGLLSTEGWKGYISIWSEKESRAFLIYGSPLNKFNAFHKKSFYSLETYQADLPLTPSLSEDAFNWSREASDDFLK